MIQHTMYHLDPNPSRWGDDATDADAAILNRALAAAIEARYRDDNVIVAIDSRTNWPSDHELARDIYEWVNRTYVNIIDEHACVYCGRIVERIDAVPVDDDEAWANLVPEHDPDCEWALTRAHQRDGSPDREQE